MGSHSVIGFLSNNSDIKKDNHRKDYVGRNIIIHDNRSICNHAAECVENLASVFRLKERPWIRPDGGSVQDIIDTVKKCPSGALSYSIGETEYRDQDRKPGDEQDHRRRAEVDVEEIFRVDPAEQAQQADHR